MNWDWDRGERGAQRGEVIAGREAEKWKKVKRRGGGDSYIRGRMEKLEPPRRDLSSHINNNMQVSWDGAGS